MKAVKHFCKVEWVLMYEERWLKAGIVMQDGSYVDRRMVHLKLNEKKTQIVYCSDYERKEKHNKVQFDFPGFSYQSRKSKSKLYQNRSYTIFTPEISKGNDNLSIHRISYSITHSYDAGFFINSYWENFVFPE